MAVFEVSGSTVAGGGGGGDRTEFAVEGLVDEGAEPGAEGEVPIGAE